MSVKRVYKPAVRTPKQLAELKAIREHYQATKPNLDEALAASGQTEAVPLGEVFALHALLKRLRDIRVQKKITLVELEGRTGIKQSALSRLETGKADNPTMGTVCRIALALGKQITCQLEDVPPAVKSPARR